MDHVRLELPHQPEQPQLSGRDPGHLLGPLAAEPYDVHADPGPGQPVRQRPGSRQHHPYRVTAPGQPGHLVGEPGAAYGRRRDLEDPQAHVLPWFLRNPASAVRYSASTWLTVVLMSKRSRHSARPRRPIWSRRAGSAIKVATASARAAGSPGGTSRPVWPWRMVSGSPPTSLATTPLPISSASTAA